MCGICGVTGGGSSSSGTSILNMSHRVKAFIFLFFSLENRWNAVVFFPSINNFFFNEKWQNIKQQFFFFENIGTLTKTVHTENWLDDNHSVWGTEFFCFVYVIQIIKACFHNLFIFGITFTYNFAMHRSTFSSIYINEQHVRHLDLKQLNALKYCCTKLFYCIVIFVYAAIFRFHNHFSRVI